jgi:hypothetical protein
MAELDARIREVIANAALDFYGPHEFEELPDFPAGARPDALALVRDGDVWSQLAPATAAASASRTRFEMFAFRFAEAPRADGFVSWLSAYLRDTAHSNVIVVCGQDRRGDAAVASGGIFDYWGCPVSCADAVLAELRALQQHSAAAAEPA